MRKLLAAVAAVSLATTAPALAGDSHHNGGGWSGGYHRHWNGYGWVWVAGSYSYRYVQLPAAAKAEVVVSPNDQDVGLAAE